MKNLLLGGKWKVEGGRNPSASRLLPSTKRSAFTLIEMIGVMAVMGILAAIVVPPLIQRLEDTQRVDEDAALEVISDSVVKGIKANFKFPNPNISPTTDGGWANLAQNFYPGGLNALLYVFPEANNFANTQRRLYLDPGLLSYIGGSLSMPATGFSSIDSDGDGTPDAEETAFRMYLVSSSKPDLFLSCPQNGSTAQPSPNFNQSLINDLLTWIKAPQDPGSANAGQILVPKSIANWASVDANNSRRGEYVHVKIVPIESLLCRVQLIDSASPPNKTLNAGNGYEKNGTVLANDLFGSSVYLYANGDGAINSGLNKDSTWFAVSTYNDRATYPVPNLQTVMPGTASVNFTLPPIPKYKLNSALAQNVSPQKTEFYVFAGTSLKLMDSSSTVLLTKIIYQHSSFTFRQGKWTID